MNGYILSFVLATREGTPLSMWLHPYLRTSHKYGGTERGYFYCKALWLSCLPTYYNRNKCAITALRLIQCGIILTSVIRHFIISLGIKGAHNEWRSTWCVIVYRYYLYQHTHTHTHTHKYICIYYNTILRLLLHVSVPSHHLQGTQILCAKVLKY